METQVKAPVKLEVPPEFGPVAKLLYEGRARVRRRWCKGAFVLANGAVCALGGVGMNERGPDSATSRAAAELLTAALPAVHRAYGVANYNDDIAQKKDIIALYDRALELALGKGI